MKKVMLFISIFLILIIFSNPSFAIYIQESDFTKEVIQEAIDLGNEYKDNSLLMMYEDNYYIFSPVHITSLEVAFMLNTDPLYYAKFNSKFINIAKLAREKSRKYQEVKEEKINDIIKKEYFTLEFVISSEDKNLIENSDDYHLVLEIPKIENNKIVEYDSEKDENYTGDIARDDLSETGWIKVKKVQPLEILEKGHSYDEGRWIGAIKCAFRYEDIQPLLDKNKDVHTEIIFITRKEEYSIRRDVNLHQLK